MHTCQRITITIGSPARPHREHAFINGDNAGMTATDTQKNTVGFPCCCKSMMHHAGSQLMAGCCKRAGVCSGQAHGAALQRGGVRDCAGAAFCAHLPLGEAPAWPRRWQLRQCTRFNSCHAMCHLQVTKAKVYVEQKPWSRLHMGETSHDHGMRSMHPRSHQEKSTVHVFTDVTLCVALAADRVRHDWH